MVGGIVIFVVIILLLLFSSSSKSERRRRRMKEVEVMMVMMLMHVAIEFKPQESGFRETYWLHLQGNFSSRSMLLPDVRKCLPNCTVTHQKRQ
jgi:hypothetical protein